MGIKSNIIKIIGHVFLYKKVKSIINGLKPIHCGRDLIRIGPDHDGGYLIPDDLDGVSHCFSPGVDTESGFDLDLAERGIKVLLADKSVDKPSISHKNFEFKKKFLKSYDDERNDFMTLDSWYQSTPSGKNANDLILQMDIEGDEYNVINSTSNDILKKFRIIVIEFHKLNKINNIFKIHKINRSFKKLMKSHSVVHIHPNNFCGISRIRDIEIPLVIEFTFYRNDRIINKDQKNKLTYPHYLDRDNVPDKETLVLPKCWWPQ